MTEELKMLFDVVHDFMNSAQRESMKSKACCKALDYLARTLTEAEWDALKAELTDQRDDEEYEDPSNYVGMGWVGSDGRP